MYLVDTKFFEWFNYIQPLYLNSIKNHPVFSLIDPLEKEYVLSLQTTCEAAPVFDLLRSRVAFIPDQDLFLIKAEEWHDSAIPTYQQLILCRFSFYAPSLEDNYEALYLLKKLTHKLPPHNPLIQLLQSNSELTFREARQMTDLL